MFLLVTLACLITIINANCLDANNLTMSLKPEEYAIGIKRQSFADAKESCNKINSQLAILDSVDKIKSAIKCFSEPSILCYFVWIGAEFVNDEFLWINGANITQNLCPGYVVPDDAVNRENLAGVLVCDYERPCVMFSEKNMTDIYICESKK